MHFNKKIAHVFILSNLFLTNLAATFKSSFESTKANPLVNLEFNIILNLFQKF